MNAFLNHFSFEFRTGIRNKSLLMMNYLFPLAFYLMMALIMPSINPGFQKSLIPSMIVFAILSATLLGIPDALVAARENGIFRSYKINGVPSFSILIIPVITAMLHLIIVSGIIVLTAALFFNAPLPTHWAYFGLTFVLLAFSCASISVLIGVVAPNSRSSILLTQTIFVPSMVLGGLMLPLEMLSESVRKVAEILPASHGMNAFNGLSMGAAASFSPGGSLIILLSSGLIALGLAEFLFSWDSQNTTRRGSTLLALLVLIPFLIGIIVL